MLEAVMNLSQTVFDYRSSLGLCLAELAGEHAFCDEASDTRSGMVVLLGDEVTESVDTSTRACVTMKLRLSLSD